MSCCHVVCLLALLRTVAAAAAGYHCRRVHISQGVSGHVLQCTWNASPAARVHGRRACGEEQGLQSCVCCKCSAKPKWHSYSIQARCDFGVYL